MNKGGCPPWHCPPSMPTWHLWCSGSRSTGRPCPVHYPGPLDPWPTLANYFGARGAHYSPSHATPPAGQFYSCTFPNGYRAFTQHQQQNDLHLVNLTNPLTNITLTLGSLGWVSLLPPNQSFAPCIPHSLHTLLGPLSHTHLSHIFHFPTHTNTPHCHSLN